MITKRRSKFESKERISICDDEDESFEFDKDFID
jgi:hypothetical protein